MPRHANLTKPVDQALLSAAAGYAPLRAFVALTALLTACASGGSSEECLPEPAVECSASINTDFESLHKNLFNLRCGTSGSGCHGPAGKQGNLVLADPDAAYAALLGKDGTAARVVPGDASCSMLMQRLETDDATRRMPRGEGKLQEGLRCAVRHWIEAGATR
jgi:hypothetical protein